MELKGIDLQDQSTGIGEPPISGIIKDQVGKFNPFSVDDRNLNTIRNENFNVTIPDSFYDQILGEEIQEYVNNPSIKERLKEKYNNFFDFMDDNINDLMDFFGDRTEGIQERLMETYKAIKRFEAHRFLKPLPFGESYEEYRLRRNKELLDEYRKNKSKPKSKPLKEYGEVELI